MKKEADQMYGGNSGCTGMVIYNTKVEGNNAVYGYYMNGEMQFKVGPRDIMSGLRQGSDMNARGKSPTGKRMCIWFVISVIVIVAAFITLPLRISFGVLVTGVLGYVPLMVILSANSSLYKSKEDFRSMCRFHGCEHAVNAVLTAGKECTMENLKAARIYDSECGTAYAGYGLFLAVELGALVAFGPGFLKSAGILLASIVLLIVLVLNPGINPFTLFQRGVVARPTEREYALGLEIMKKVKELE